MGMDGAVGLDWSVTVVLSARWGTMSNESPPQTLGTPQSVPPSLRVWVREGALPLMAVDGIRGMSPFH